MSRQDGAECLDNLIREALKTSQTYLKFWVHENEVGNSVTRAKHALSEIEGTQEPKTKIRSTKSETNSNDQKHTMFQTTLIRIPRFGIARVLSYLAAVCFEFRYSDFGFSMACVLAR